MVVSTNSEDIRKARKMALELLLSDHAGDCVAPCQARCPAGLDIARFVYELASGRPRDSQQVILETLALPGSLGRICPRLCETGCRRCDLDEGLAIGALHRFAADQDRDSVGPFSPPLEESSGKNVGIIGAGPAGLAAAFFLLQRGHGCTLFDSQPEPGGMLRYGIPEYRLPYDALDSEIELISRMGAEFQMNSTWGIDFTLEELHQRYDALFVAIGAWRSQNLRCSGDELAIPGIEFLESVTKETAPTLGPEVIVIGGGNTAIDAARTAIRLGADSVKILYRRTRKEMPCLMEEVEAAESEGVEIQFLIAPVGLKRISKGALQLTCQRMELGESDDSGRKRPVEIKGSEFELVCSSVVSATGQSVDTSLAEREGLETSSWGIASDSNTLATNIPGVFAGGDAVLGADLAVRAVAAGRIAAVSIHQYLTGEPVVGLDEKTSIEMRAINDEERAFVFREIERSPRPEQSSLSLQERISSFAEVERGLSELQVAKESKRCMTCGCRKSENCVMRQLATEYQVDPYRFVGERRSFSQDTTHPEIIYEPGKCIMCDACVRIAAEAGEELGIAPIGRGFQVAVGVPFGKPLSEGLKSAAQRAAQACPTGALALRSNRSCDLGLCSSCPSDDMVGLDID
jgi:formate dehydrogenase major subunit